MIDALSNQIHIEMQTYNVQSGIADLAKCRLDPATADLLIPEMDRLCASLTALQLLVSHMQGAKPMLRVVR